VISWQEQLFTSTPQRSKQMSEEQGLEFDLEPRRVKVRIGQSWYWLQEASGDAGTKFKSAAIAAARMDDGKVVGVQGVADVEPKLVAACLYEMRGKDDPAYKVTRHNGDPVHVTEEFVRSIPGRIQSVLFDKVMEMSPWLKDKDTPESIKKAEELLARRKAALLNGSADPKNSPSDGEDGSSCAGNSASTSMR